MTVAKEPPKTSTHDTSPKDKAGKAPTPGRGKVFSALRALSDAPTKPEHFEQYAQETRAEKSDRGAAILLATNLETALQSAIERLLAVSDDARHELFGSENAPIGTFSNKIRIGHALRIFGDETRGNLEIIRRIRNAFAHVKIPITFDTEQVRNACALLALQKLNPPVLSMSSKPSREVDEAMPGRLRYLVVCENTSFNLIRWLMAGPAGIAKEALQVKLPDDYQEIWARSLPLP